MLAHILAPYPTPHRKGVGEWHLSKCLMQKACNEVRKLCSTE